MKGKEKKSAKELKLTSMNESASKKKKPFEYENSNESELKPFSLKDLDPDQMM